MKNGNTHTDNCPNNCTLNNPHLAEFLSLLEDRTFIQALRDLVERQRSENALWRRAFGDGPDQDSEFF